MAAFPPTTRRLLDELVKAAAAKPNGRLDLPRRIKPGSELVRTWNRRDLSGHGADKGFAYDGKTFASLSEIATAITGTRWNGPRFFGLRIASLMEAIAMAIDTTVLCAAPSTPANPPSMDLNRSSTRWMLSGRPARPISRARRSQGWKAAAPAL